MRHRLVSRRQTSIRKLQINIPDQCLAFIQKVHKIIEEKMIKRSNILNFDQMPRAFEVEHRATIVQKGSRDVYVNKSTGH